MTLEERVNTVVKTCEDEIQRMEVFMNIAEKREDDSEWLRYYDLRNLYEFIRDILNGKYDLEIKENR